MRYNIIILIPFKELNVEEAKNIIENSGLRARYNIGPIPKSLTETFAPIGGMIYPVSMQDEIWGGLESGDYSDFDISKWQSYKDKKEIEKNGTSNHMIAASWASIQEIKTLDSMLATKDVFIWHWHQWIEISKIDNMKWAY
ncbi:hypothetical protein A3715_19865 [Oleiphilus sp. HI0009]|nr:hypothetical protein A3715_19865 [Oleiphilus sp. HI0009]